MSNIYESALAGFGVGWPSSSVGPLNPMESRRVRHSLSHVYAGVELLGAVVPRTASALVHARPVDSLSCLSGQPAARAAVALACVRGPRELDRIVKASGDIGEVGDNRRSWRDAIFSIFADVAAEATDRDVKKQPYHVIDNAARILSSARLPPPVCGGSLRDCHRPFSYLYPVDRTRALLNGAHGVARVILYSDLQRCEVYPCVDSVVDCQRENGGRVVDDNHLLENAARDILRGQEGLSGTDAALAVSQRQNDIDWYNGHGNICRIPGRNAQSCESDNCMPGNVSGVTSKPSEICSAPIGRDCPVASLPDQCLSEMGVTRDSLQKPAAIQNPSSDDTVWQDSHGVSKSVFNEPGFALKNGGLEHDATDNGLRLQNLLDRDQTDRHFPQSGVEAKRDGQIMNDFESPVENGALAITNCMNADEKEPISNSLSASADNESRRCTPGQHQVAVTHDYPHHDANPAVETRRSIGLNLAESEATDRHSHLNGAESPKNNRKTSVPDVNTRLSSAKMMDGKSETPGSQPEAELPLSISDVSKARGFSVYADEPETWFVMQGLASLEEEVGIRVGKDVPKSLSALAMEERCKCMEVDDVDDLHGKSVAGNSIVDDSPLTHLDGGKRRRKVSAANRTEDDCYDENDRSTPPFQVRIAIKQSPSGQASRSKVKRGRDSGGKSSVRAEKRIRLKDDKTDYARSASSSLKKSKDNGGHEAISRGVLIANGSKFEDANEFPLALGVPNGSTADPRQDEFPKLGKVEASGKLTKGAGPALSSQKQRKRRQKRADEDMEWSNGLRISAGRGARKSTVRRDRAVSVESPSPRRRARVRAPAIFDDTPPPALSRRSSSRRQVGSYEESSGSSFGSLQFLADNSSDEDTAKTDRIQGAVKSSSSKRVPEVRADDFKPEASESHPHDTASADASKGHNAGSYLDPAVYIRPRKESNVETPAESRESSPSLPSDGSDVDDAVNAEAKFVTGLGIDGISYSNLFPLQRAKSIFASEEDSDSEAVPAVRLPRNSVSNDKSQGSERKPGGHKPQPRSSSSAKSSKILQAASDASRRPAKEIESSKPHEQRERTTQMNEKMPVLTTLAEAGVSHARVDTGKKEVGSSNDASTKKIHDRKLLIEKICGDISQEHLNKEAYDMIAAWTSHPTNLLDGQQSKEVELAAFARPCHECPPDQSGSVAMCEESVVVCLRKTGWRRIRRLVHRFSKPSTAEHSA